MNIPLIVLDRACAALEAARVEIVSSGNTGLYVQVLKAQAELSSYVQFIQEQTKVEVTE